METIWLQRSNTSVPWGFRLVGGREFGLPLTVQRITPGSVAAAGLGTGDVVLKVGNIMASDLGHNEAMDLVKQAGNILQLTIKKTHDQSDQYSSQVSAQLNDNSHGTYATTPRSFGGSNNNISVSSNASQNNYNYNSSNYSNPNTSNTGYSTTPRNYGSQQQSQQNSQPQYGTRIEIHRINQTPPPPRQMNAYNDYQNGSQDNFPDYTIPYKQRDPIHDSPGGPVDLRNNPSFDTPTNNHSYDQSSSPYSSKPQPRGSDYSSPRDQAYEDPSSRNYYDYNQEQRDSAPSNMSSNPQLNTGFAYQPNKSASTPYNYNASPITPSQSYSQPSYNSASSNNIPSQSYAQPSYNSPPAPTTPSQSYNQPSYNSAPAPSSNSYNARPVQSPMSPRSQSSSYNSPPSSYYTATNDNYEPSTPQTTSTPYGNSFAPSSSSPPYNTQYQQPTTPSYSSPSYPSSTSYNATPKPFSSKPSTPVAYNPTPAPFSPSYQPSQPKPYQSPMSPTIASPPVQVHQANPVRRVSFNQPDLESSLSPRGGYQHYKSPPPPSIQSNGSYESPTYSRSNSRHDEDYGSGYPSRSNDSYSNTYPTPAPYVPSSPSTDLMSPRSNQYNQPSYGRGGYGYDPSGIPEEEEEGEKIPDQLLNTVLQSSKGGGPKPFSYGINLNELKKKVGPPTAPKKKGPHPSQQSSYQLPQHDETPRFRSPKKPAGFIQSDYFPSRKDTTPEVDDSSLRVSMGSNPKKQSKSFKVLQWMTETEKDDASEEEVTHHAGPKRHRDPDLRHNADDDEMKFTGLHGKADIPSKTFDRLKKSTPEENGQDEIQAEDDTNEVGNYNEASIRYTGKSIPSPAFRVLQTWAEHDPDVDTGNAKGDDEEDGLPDTLSSQDMEDKRYKGGQIPSKAFKTLQMSVGNDDDEQQGNTGGASTDF